MKTKKKSISQSKPEEELKRTAKAAINNALAGADADPDETVLCVPGGKCYTRAELAALETSDMPLFEAEGDDSHAEK